MIVAAMNPPGLFADSTRYQGLEQRSRSLSGWLRHGRASTCRGSPYTSSRHQRSPGRASAASSRARWTQTESPPWAGRSPRARRPSVGLGVRAAAGVTPRADNFVSSACSRPAKPLVSTSAPRPLLLSSGSWVRVLPGALPGAQTPDQPSLPRRGGRASPHPAPRASVAESHDDPLVALCQVVAEDGDCHRRLGGAGLEGHRPPCPGSRCQGPRSPAEPTPITNIAAPIDPTRQRNLLIVIA
jgi:hypothetical protein